MTLAISVMGATLRLPVGYVQRHGRELAMILGLGLPLMCLSGSLLAWLLLSVPLLTALLLGSVLAPTDPVLADSIIAGKTAEDTCRRACATRSLPRAAPTTGSPCSW